MSLSCGCDDDDGYVELDPDYMSVAKNTIICRECRNLIKPGDDYYRIRLWSYDEFGDEEENGVREVCEGCGDLAYTILKLGYCYTYGSLRADVREMAQMAEDERLRNQAWKLKQASKSQN